MGFYFLSPFFDKEKEQKDWVKAHPGQTPDENAIKGQVYQNFYDQAFNATGLGTGGAVQQGIQAATAVVQGLAGGDIAAAMANGASPYLAEAIGHRMGIDDNPEAKAVAHAIVGAALAAAQGQNAAAGATGAALGEITAGILKDQLYGKDAKIADLTETQKQTLSALATLSSGLAGGLVGDSTESAVYAAQAGKTAENNFLSASSSDRLDKSVEKIKQGDNSLAAASELIKLENADKRSDALVSKFTKDPSQMNSTERAELAGYLRVYASEMEKEYGPAVSQELVKGMLSGQDYIKRNPDSEAMSKAQTIMNTWGYHKSNASMGDAPLIFGSSVLGNTIKEGMALNAAIGVGVNTGVQLTGRDPFSYVDAIMAGVTAAATTGKGLLPSARINMGGAAVGSGIKGEDPTNSVIGTGFGSVLGSGTGKAISGIMGSSIKESTTEVISAIGGSVASETVGNTVKGALDEADKSTKK